MKTRKALASILILAIVTTLVPTVANAAELAVAEQHIAGGSNYSAVLCEDGTIYLWGERSSLYLAEEDKDARSYKHTATKEGLKFVSIATGMPDYTVGLDSAGTVYVWSPFGQSKPIENAVAIAGGKANIMALKSDGTVWQWNESRGLEQVLGLSNIAAISSGDGYSLALTNSGEVYAWGDNFYGQLGTGDTILRDTPVKVPGLSDIVDIAAGYSHSLAVSRSGKVYGWGDNSCKAVGAEETNNILTPVEVSELSNAVKVATGMSSSMALTQDGEVYTWGYGEYGQIGNGTTVIKQPAPTKVDGLPKVTEIAAGAHHDMALTENGELYTWGRDRSGQLGFHSAQKNRNTPKSVFNLKSPAKEATDAMQGGIVYEATQTVNVDGKAVELPCYAIKDRNGNPTNYVKLRDMAAVLNGTKAQFDVGWDGNVRIKRQKAYTPNGSEMSTPFTGNQIYFPARSAYVSLLEDDPDFDRIRHNADVDSNGIPYVSSWISGIVLTDDEGGAYTYYKLRDLSYFLNFNVKWDPKAGVIRIETGEPYDAKN